MLVVYSAWICPFELAFLRHLSWVLFLVENIVNSFFAIDIILTFFLAYLIGNMTNLVVQGSCRTRNFVSSLPNTRS